MEGHRREFGIGADRADSHELAHARFPGLVQQRHTHHQVIVEEVGRMGSVRTDAADAGSEVDDDDVGTLNVERSNVSTEELADGLDVPQVVVLATGDDDAFVASEGVAVGPGGV